MRASVTESSALVASSRIRIGGFFEQRARDRQTLPLAAGQGRAALADQRLVALGLAHDEVVRLGEPGRLLELGLRRVGLADPQIVGDRAVEHRRILEHHADVAAKRFELDVAMVDAVDADHARLGVPHAMQQRQRRALARTGRADEGDRRARRHVQAEMHQRRPLAVIGEVHVLEVDIALGAADILAVRPVGHGRLVVEHAEEVGQCRHLEEDAADEARGLVHAADQHGREAHEADDLADGRLVARVEPGAEHEDRDHRHRRGGARQHREQRPPVQHRILRRQRLADDAAHLAGLGAQPHEALDQMDVAQRVARPAGKLAVIFLDPRLQPVGLADDPGIGDGEEEDQHDQQRAEPPVHEQAERQHDEQRHEGREVLAEEAQPDAEQMVDAGQHDLEQPAGMLGVVERERQHQHVLEIVRHGAEPAAMRHAVGLQRDDDVGDDAADADGSPQHQELPRIVPECFVGLVPGVGQQVDDPAEQHRLVELQRRHGDVGEGKHDRQPALVAQQPDHPTVDAEELHVPMSPRTRCHPERSEGSMRINIDPSLKAHVNAPTRDDSVRE